MSNDTTGSLPATSFPSPEQVSARRSPSALRANILWFLSLSLSLVVALMCTLAKQWTRYYFRDVQLYPEPHKRARMRQYLFDGRKAFGAPNVLSAVPPILHVSLLLFFAGLVNFLKPINSALAYLMLALLLIIAVLYIVISVLPAIHHNCPYRTPLSPGIWWIWKSFSIVAEDIRRNLQSKPMVVPSFVALLRKATAPNIDKDLQNAAYQEAILSVERQALAIRKRRDMESLRWTVSRLSQDSRFETFVEGIPAFLQQSGRFLGTSEVTPDETLVGYTPLFLLYRIFTLLATCNNSGVAQMHSRASACFAAIWCILDSPYYTFLPFSVQQVVYYMSIVRVFIDDKKEEATTNRARITRIAILSSTLRSKTLSVWSHLYAGNISTLREIMRQCAAAAFGTRTFSLWEARLEGLQSIESSLNLGQLEGERYLLEIQRVYREACMLIVIDYIIVLTEIDFFPSEVLRSRGTMLPAPSQALCGNPELEAVFLESMRQSMAIRESRSTLLPVGVIEQLLPFFKALNDRTAIEEAIELVGTFNSHCPGSTIAEQTLEALPLLLIGNCSCEVSY
jgi:hypothetical protein